MPILVDVQKNSNSEKLVDSSSTGKRRPWKTHKQKSLLLSNSFARLGKDKKADRVQHCGEFLKFTSCPNGHEKRLKNAIFCQVRLCPMCGWRKSLKIAGQVKEIAHIANESFKIRWLFLTLTCNNVEGYELPDQLDQLTTAWKRLFQQKVFEKNVLGFFRSLEVTRDGDQYITQNRYAQNPNYYDSRGLMVGSHNPNWNTYHPHFHVLLAVRPSYFGHSYLKQSDWTNMWREALRADYNPIVDIRVVKSKRNRSLEEKILRDRGIKIENGNFEEISNPDDFLPESAVAEIAKYATKADDYIVKNIDETDEAVQILSASLKGRRMFAYGGVLKDIYDALKKDRKIEDVDSGEADLIHTDSKKDAQCSCSICESDFMEVIYKWIPERKNYFKVDG